MTKPRKMTRLRSTPPDRGVGRAFALAVTLAAFGLPAAALLAPQPAAAQELSQLSCRALWYQRNAVFAEQGYCFKTADAIATFGERCYPPYGKLTPDQQRYVDQVRYWEARKGCN